MAPDFFLGGLEEGIVEMWQIDHALEDRVHVAGIADIAEPNRCELVGPHRSSQALDNGLFCCLVGLLSHRLLSSLSCGLASVLFAFFSFLLS